MAYDEKLADRVRDQLAPIEQLAELKMFGGIVDPSGITTAKNLDRWVARGVDFASSLPPKSAKSTTSTKQRPRKRK